MKILRSNPIRRRRGWVGAASSLLVLLILMIYPLVTLLMQIIFPHIFDVKMNFTPTIKPLIQTFSDIANLTAVFNSFWIGILASAVATILGTLTAFGSAKAPKYLKAVLDAAVWVVFFTPSYVIAEGWILLMQDGGILAQIFGLHNGWSAWFFTRLGLIVTMGFRYFPFVHMAMEQAVQNVGAQFLNAGRMLGATRQQVFLKVLLPLLTPALLAGASIAFAEGFGDFGFAAAITPQTNIPLIAYQIYSALNEAPVNYSAAAGLSLLLIIVTGGTLLLQMWWMRRKSYVTVSASSNINPVFSSRKISFVSALSLGIAFIAVILPVGSTFIESIWKSVSGGLLSSNWTLQNYVQAFQIGSNGIQALTESFFYALIAAFFTMVIALFVAHQMAFRQSIGTRLLNLVIMSSIAIPGVVLAAGFIFAWNAVWLIPIHLVLYGTSTCLVLAYIAGHLPYAIRLQTGAMSQISPNLATAARVLGARNGTVLRRIIFPLVSATTISTFFLTFTDTMFELPASSLLYPAGHPPFPVLINSKFDAFQWGQGAALTMIGMLFVFGTYILGKWLIYQVEHRKFGKKQTVYADAELLEAEIILSLHS